MQARTLIVLGIALFALPALGQSLVVDTANSPYAVAGTESFAQVQVESGGVLVLDGTLQVSGDLVVKLGGVVTRTQSPARGVVQVGGLFDVQFGALVDLQGRGLRGGLAAGNPFGCRGEGFDPSSFAVVAAANEYQGGSHGGQGGRSAQPLHGLAQAPVLPGAGGGCRTSGSVPGGAGGGALEVTAGTLRVDGTLRADGVNGTGQSGAGAGGALYLTCQDFAGAGLVSARGGNAASVDGGGGGGGRLAVEAATWSFTGTLNALGGTSPNAANNGTAGTVWARHGGSNFILANGHLVLGAGHQAASLTLRPGATLRITGPLALAAPLEIVAGSTVLLESTDAMSAMSLAPAVAGVLVVNAPAALQTVVLTGTLRANQPVSAQDLTIKPGGLLTHDAGGAGVRLAATGSILVEAGGSVDVSAKGLANNTSLDPMTLQPIGGSGNGVGGSHGGQGAPKSANPARPAYGAERAPALLGAGASSTLWDAGQRGGGRVELAAATLRVDGQVLANGAYPGGAGGSVYLEAGVFEGVGRVEAVGANGVSGINGGITPGGGGRIHAKSASATFAGPTSALGGLAGGSGLSAQSGKGSVLLEVDGPQRHLVVVNGYATVGTETFGSITLLQNATLFVDGSPTVAVPVSLPAGAEVRLRHPAALAGLALANQLDGTLVVESPAALQGQRGLAGRLVVDAPLEVGALTLSGTARLDVNALLEVKEDLLLPPGARITHAARARTMDLRVKRRLHVPAGALVVADGLGLPGGNKGAFGCSGTAIDSVTFAEVAGASTSGGGSFGGAGGGATNPVYGSDINMELPGAGGGCQSTSGGGDGGGLLRLQAGHFELDGAVTARGANGAGQAGGGAGGAIRVTVGRLSGSGTFGVEGGASGTLSGGGGGAGRIRVEAAQTLFTGSYLTTGGGGFAPGAAQPETTVALTAAAPVIVSAPPLTAGLGMAWSYQPDAAGTQPIGWSLVMGPPGATVNATTGLLAWTPQAAGLGLFQLRAQNAHGADDQLIPVQVLQAPKIASTAAIWARVNEPYAYNAVGAVIATGTGPFAFSVPVAPTGAPAFQVDAQGKVKWTPVSVGAVPACVRVENPAGFDQQCFTVDVRPDSEPPLIVSTPPAGAWVDTAYVYPVEVQGSPPIVLSLLPGAHPTGATLDVDGVLTWTPVAVGPATFCLEALGAGIDHQCWTLDVEPAAVAPQIVSTCNPVATVGVDYSYDADRRASATGSGAITFDLQQGPPGMAVAADGTVTWQPEVTGHAQFTLRAQSEFGAGTQLCEVVVRTVDGSGPPLIVHEANPHAAVGLPWPYSALGRLRAFGDGPLTWARVSGPTSLQVDPATGAVGWVPQGAGPVTVTVSAQNALGADQYTFTVNVVAAPPPGPAASMSVAPTSGEAPLAVSFDGSASTSPGPAPLLAHRWSFGDGAPAAYGPAAAHTYGGCSGYFSDLTVKDVYGQQASAYERVLVGCGGLRPPSARIVLAELVGASSTTAHFHCDCKEGSAPLLGYQWLSTDGFFSDLPAASHGFGPGAHTLQLIVVDQNGLSAVHRVVVTVPQGGNLPPQVSAFADPPAAQAPATVRFGGEWVDLDGVVEKVEWTFLDGTHTSEPSPVRQYDAPGVERATLTVTDGQGLSSSALVEVAVSGAGGQPPEFLSRPRESVFAGEDYTYDKDGVPTLRGTGPMQVRLTRGPEGAALDPESLVLRWQTTSKSTGRHDFELTAEGPGGSDRQGWTVEVVALGETKGCGCGAGGAGGALLAALALGVLGRRRSRRPAPLHDRKGAA